MKNKKYSFLTDKNSQRGASGLEVIFALGLVVVLTPFLYNQISEMTHVIKDIVAAKRITDNRTRVLNYVRSNQDNIAEGSSEISSEVLASIAPDAIKGRFFQLNVGNANVRNIEVYLLFHVNNTKYRTASIAKYIGGNAAVVEEDNRAYAKDWIVEVPTSWVDSESINQENNYLVYRIVRDFSGEDKNVFLHRSSFGDNLNQMQRALHMNYYDLVNVNNFIVRGVLGMADVQTSDIEADFVSTPKTQFFSGANVEGGQITFENLNVVNNMQGLGTGTVETTDLYGDTSESGVESFTTKNVLFTENIELNGLNLDASTQGSVYVNPFVISGDLRVPNLTAVNIKLDGNDKIVAISSETSEGGSTTKAVALQLGDWGYRIPDGSQQDYSLDNGGPELQRVCVGGKYSKEAAACDGIALENMSLLMPNANSFGLVKEDGTDNTDGVVLSDFWLDEPPCSNQNTTCPPLPLD